MNRLLVLGLMAVPSLPVVAQGTLTVPTALTNTPGSSSTAWPLGLATQNNIQYIYDSQEVGLAGPTALRSIAVRAQETGSNVAKTGIDIEISMSSTSVAAAAATTTFANNRGANHTVVYARRLTNVPATTPGFIGQYAGPFPLDAPFIHQASPTTGLLVEYNTTTAVSGTWSHDTGFTAAGPHVTIGTGCGGFSAGSSGGAIGTNLLFTTTGGVPNNPAVLLIGMQLFPVAVPIPGTTGCNLYQQIAATVNVALAAAGTTTVTLPVPNNTFLRGFAIYGQFGSVDAGGGLISTNTRAAVINGPWATARVYNNTNAASLTGTVQQQVGIITQFGL
jgi:hypothetical protein